MKPDARCKVCGLPMFDVGFAEHPSCADEPDAARIRAEHAAAEAGRQGQLDAANGSWDDYAIAVDMIRRTAVKLRVFSANDISDKDSPLYDPRWAMLGGHVPGSAMGAARRKGWCIKTGRTVPSLLAKGCHIPEWESRLYVDEFKVGLISPAAGVSRSTGRQAS